MYTMYIMREKTCYSMESTFIYNFTYLHIIDWAIVLLWLISPSNSKTLEVDIYHFAIQKRNIHTTPPLDYAILLRLSVTQDFALAYLHKAKNFFEDYGHNLLQSKWIALYETPPRMVQKIMANILQNNKSRSKALFIWDVGNHHTMVWNETNFYYFSRLLTGNKCIFLI